MESVIIDKIPAKISNKIYDVLWLEESVEALTCVVQKLSSRIDNLESKQPLTKVSSGHQRPEILFDIVKNTRSIKSKQVRHIFGLKQNHQAIRIMKTTARRYSDSVYIHKSKNGHKEISLNMKEIKATDV